MEQQIIEILTLEANGIVDLVGNRIYPVLLDNGNMYPAIAFILEVEALSRGVNCVFYGGELILLVEAKDRGQLKTLRTLIINAFNTSVFRFKRYSDEFETVSKTYYSEIFINIINIKEDDI